MWAIVNFVKENTVEAVPTKWLEKENEKCFWPPKNWSITKIMAAIRNNEEVHIGSWLLYDVKILGQYGSLLKAQKKASLATELTDISSCNEDIVRINNPSDSSDDESSIENLPSYSGISKVTATNFQTARVDDSIVSQQDHHQSYKRKMPSEMGSASTSTRVSYDDFETTIQEKLQASKRKLLYNSTTTSHEGDPDSDFKKQVLRHLLTLRHVQQQQSDTLDLILKKSQVPSNEEVEKNMDGPFLKLFPLNNDQDFGVVETYLEDDENYKVMVKYIYRIGGHDVREMVRRVMYSLFTNEWGVLYSWEGAKKKKKFKDFRLAKAIIDGVRMNSRTADAQDDLIIKFIKGWLVRANERINIQPKRC